MARAGRPPPPEPWRRIPLRISLTQFAKLEAMANGKRTLTDVLRGLIEAAPAP